MDNKEKYLEFRKAERMAHKQIEDAVSEQFVKICEIQEEIGNITHESFRVVTPFGEVTFIFRPQATFSYKEKED